MSNLINSGFMTKPEFLNTQYLKTDIRVSSKQTSVMIRGLCFYCIGIVPCFLASFIDTITDIPLLMSPLFFSLSYSFNPA